MNRARDEILAGAALAGDEHGQIVALHPLDLIGDALHRGAGADEPGQQRLERTLDGARGRFDRTLARAAQIEALAQHRAQGAKALQRGRG